MALAAITGCTPAPDEVTPTDTETADAASTEGPPVDASSGTTTATTGDAVDDTGTSTSSSEGTSTDGPRAECGNGELEDGEACDDAGESARCNDDCSAAACGDGIVNVAAGEACDGAGETGGCNTDCSLAACGDGIVNMAAGEACDDAGESAACNVDCSLAACGDAEINAAAGEECDGAELGGTSCQDLGFTSGALACDPGCALDASGCTDAPEAPVLLLGFSPIKQFDFAWAPAAGAALYRLEQSAAPGEPFVQIGGDILGESISVTMPLHFRWDASHRLLACNDAGCTASAAVDVAGSLAEAVGYVKATNTDGGDFFGYTLAFSADGSTLAISAYNEDGSTTGIGGDQTDNNALSAGAVYVLVRDGAGTWTQQAYIKASNTGAHDIFGIGLSLSNDGNTLAVGAGNEDSSATGVGGDQTSDAATLAGAAYVLVRDGAGTWTQQAYIKASNAEAFDGFGGSVALSGDGDTLVVGAPNEDGAATGVNGDQASNAIPDSGAAYVFVRDGVGAWSQQAYLKASNTDGQDFFGLRVAISGSGDTLAVGVQAEDSSATGVGGGQADDSMPNSGAVYVYARDGAGAWSQQAYVKASNTGGTDFFGMSVALSEDGDTLAVGAGTEDSSATGIDGDEENDMAPGAGATYVFERDGAGAWSQQAYIKASNTGGSDFFGCSVALSEDGNVLAVGAYAEDGEAVGLDGAQLDDSALNAGAAYVFVRDGAGAWTQAAYVKASNTDAEDHFGQAVALSGDGSILAVGAYQEASDAFGIGSDQTDDSLPDAGAVYLY